MGDPDDAHQNSISAEAGSGRATSSTAVEVGALPARSVRVPGAIVDAVVVDPLQQMGYDVVYDPTMSGEIKGPPRPVEPQPFTVRQLIARRAADEYPAVALVARQVPRACEVCR